MQPLPSISSASKSRLQALYSDISRQKHSNPASFHANVEWWRNTLIEAITMGALPDTRNRLVLSANRKLIDAFRYEGVGKPLSLGCVIAELQQSNKLIPLSHFLSSAKSVYDTGSLPWRIASYVVGKPLWWALEQLSIVNSDDTRSDAEWWKRVDGDHVVLELVEKAADVIIAQQREKTAGSVAETLYNLNGFRREFLKDAGIYGPLSDVDVQVLLRFLERDRKVLIADEGVYKFINADLPGAKEISPVERGILQLKSAIQNLYDQTDSLQRQIDEYNTTISILLRQGRKPAALMRLRHRKQLEELLNQRLGSLGTLEDTLLRVETSAGDIIIMETYKSSAATLKSILSHPSLQRESVEDTMEALASANDGAREIEQMIRVGGDVAAADAGIDESELERELEALTRDVENENARKEQEKLLDGRIKALNGAMVSPDFAHEEEQSVSGKTRTGGAKQLVANS